MASPVHISVSRLSRLVGTHAAPLLLDVRTDEDFEDDPRLLPAAIRHPFSDMASLVPLLTDRKIVVYCQKGRKLSEGAAAILRNHGLVTEVLEGGHFGWRDAGEPLIDTALIPNKNAAGQTVWVTRLRPKIDRIACPWLIRRFVDENAQFLFVTASEVAGVAERFNAAPFDIEGVQWSHIGDKCTFDSLLEKFKLDSEPLQRLARIVRGADTDNLASAPECAGLLAASLGLSRMYSDDLQQLDAGMVIYDALYRWSRDATDERHDWPGTTAKKS